MGCSGANACPSRVFDTKTLAPELPAFHRLLLFRQYVSLRTRAHFRLPAHRFVLERGVEIFLGIITIPIYKADE